MTKHFFFVIQYVQPSLFTEPFHKYEHLTILHASFHNFSKTSFKKKTEM